MIPEVQHVSKKSWNLGSMFVEMSINLKYPFISPTILHPEGLKFGDFLKYIIDQAPLITFHTPKNAL